MIELTAGDWEVEVRARDLALNVDPTPATCSFNIAEVDPCDPDNDPPNTSITSGCEDYPPGTEEVTLGVAGSDPNNCTPSSSLQFSWRKRLNSGSWGSWSGYTTGSSVIITGLSAGDWDVEVRARDLSLNEDPTPANCRFLIGDGNFVWARTWPGASMYEAGETVTCDYYDNIYVAGGFSGTVDFDPGPGEDWHSSIDPWSDAFISKFDVDGNFKWAITWGSEHMELVYGITTDELGNVFVTGWFEDTADFDPGPGEEWRTNNGLSDVFLCKFSSDGELDWVRTWGGAGMCLNMGLSIDRDVLGNVYCTGKFMGNCDFDPGPGEDWHIGDGLTDVFASKFNSNGTFIWAKTWGGYHCDEGRGITVNQANCVYITGGFRYDVDFDPGPGEDWHYGSDETQFFLSKLDYNGSFQWARTEGGTELDYGNSVATERFGSGSQVFITGGSIYLKSFSRNGDFEWEKTWDGSNCDWNLNRGPNIIDKGSYTYVSGMFTGTVDFDPGSGIDEHSSNGSDDIFLSKFSYDGNHIWTNTWGGTDEDISAGVAIDRLGNFVYVKGTFKGEVDFDPGSAEDWHIGDGFYLSKFNPDE